MNARIHKIVIEGSLFPMLRTLATTDRTTGSWRFFTDLISSLSLSLCVCETHHLFGIVVVQRFGSQSAVSLLKFSLVAVQSSAALQKHALLVHTHRIVLACHLCCSDSCFLFYRNCCLHALPSLASLSEINQPRQTRRVLPRISLQKQTDQNQTRLWIRFACKPTL